MAHKYEDLVHKLTYHQSIINSLLDIPCANKFVKLAAIKRKIVALEELVLDLPYEDGSGPFEEWRDTVTDLYRRFFAFASEKMKKPKKAAPSSKKVASKDVSSEKSSTSEEIETGNEASNGSVTSSGSGSNSSVVKKKSQSTSDVQGNLDDRATQTPRRFGGLVKHRSMNFRRSAGLLPPAEPEKSIEEQKEQLRAFLEETFAKLEPVEEITVESDLEGFRVYAFIVNRSIRQLSRFEEDAEFMSKVLSYVLPKAPPTVVERFNSLNESEEKEDEEKENEEGAESKRPPLKGLRLLKKCLVAELTTFYEALKAALVTEDSGDSDVDASRTCYLCKSDRHYKSGCPQVRMVRFIFVFLTDHFSFTLGEKSNLLPLLQERPQGHTVWSSLLQVQPDGTHQEVLQSLIIISKHFFCFSQS